MGASPFSAGEPAPGPIRCAFMANLMRLLPLLFCLSAAAGASAQVVPPPENVVQLATSSTVEVPQDVLSLQLVVTREGSDPAQVQAQLKQVLEQALAEAKRASQPGGMDVRTGQFSIAPRHNREGRISAWQGSAELILEGTDLSRISQVAGRLPGMQVGSAHFRLSREARERAERDAQAQAVERFRVKAAELARTFGFQGYSLREVSVHAQDPGFPPPRPRMMAMEARAASDAAVPVEAGRSAVVVTVSGSVQLR